MSKVGWCGLNGVGGWYEWKGCGVFMPSIGLTMINGHVINEISLDDIAM